MVLPTYDVTGRKAFICLKLQIYNYLDLFMDQCRGGGEKIDYTSLFLKVFKLAASTTSCGRLFHSLQTRLEKNLYVERLYKSVVARSFLS